MSGPGDALAARLGATITDLHRLSGGASRETWAFTADGRPLILRRDPPAAPDAEAMAREAALLSSAAAAGVPVPTLVDHGDDLDGAPYLIMERLAGETIPRRLLRTPRPGLARDLGAILARLHTMASVPGLPDADPLDALAEYYDAFGEPRPAVELAFRRLREHRPSPTGRTVVHGDFRNGNLMIDGPKVTGVLDWELSHLGDPAEDLGWLCVKAWRFGSPHPVGGFGPREDLLAGYADGGGTPPDPGVLHWWEVYGTLRWTILCRHQAERYLSGADPSIEYAVLGRKVCEQEHDLLLALGLTEPVTVPDPLGEAGGGADGAEPDAGAPPHDRPSAPALLEAVERFVLEADHADDRQRFHARVAASALRVARRELLLGDAHRAAHARRLASLGCADDAELALGVRDGRFDDRADDVVAAVRASIVDKLTVANPRHLATPP
ncbi:phosphotransferase family protein [Actinomadura algeriensis]|uniref:Aminoglycoside phosphotransferase (APT) family kinase protein n=1 Tax=Actinomadura algeriensis TaxID=1679523 RepID=A0ABR9JN19_9ACTN|nr:phosphotransferase family protein [Actinomadura algeriensis]MBE1531957.1 aminoglycoside phosphotransferase (APT) family kinase protein [Actinomadura algeriensis]